MTVLALVFVVAPNTSSAFAVLQDMSVILYMGMYVFMFAAAIKLRRSQPDRERPIKIRGLPVIAGVGILAAVSAIVLGLTPPVGLLVDLARRLRRDHRRRRDRPGVPPQIIYRFRRPEWDTDPDALERRAHVTARSPHRGERFEVITKIGRKVLWFCAAATVVVLVLGIVFSPWWLLLEIIFVPLALVGLRDIAQKQHSILRNYPIAGHLRFILEDMGPELHQYLVESDTDGRAVQPRHALDHLRARQGRHGHEAVRHRAGRLRRGLRVSQALDRDAPRGRGSGAGPARSRSAAPQCTQPYSLSVLNISAMSFGALGGQRRPRDEHRAPRRATSRTTPARAGISRYHRGGGGDLIWQIGTGYFGCRKPTASFDPDLFAKNATDPQVKMIEIKVSQGAKPGHGGILPGAKVTEEIAEARLVRGRQDRLLADLPQRVLDAARDDARSSRSCASSRGGKPVGFKICIGEPREFMGDRQGDARDRRSTPTSSSSTAARAAPARRRRSSRTRWASRCWRASRSCTTRSSAPACATRSRSAPAARWSPASTIATALALGADWCNSARGFMFSVGCIQAQRCNTNRCPVGVTTQNPKLQRALVVPDKAERVHALPPATPCTRWPSSSPRWGSTTRASWRRTTSSAHQRDAGGEPRRDLPRSSTPG